MRMHLTSIVALAPRSGMTRTRKRAARSDVATTLHPMRRGLARMVAALRGVIAAVTVLAAMVGAVPPVSWHWLGPALALVIVWTPLYVTVAWTRGLRAWLVGVDLVVAAVLSVGVAHLVPAPALAGTTNWVSTIASMTVVAAQLGGAPRLSVPAGLLVVTCYVTGERLGGSVDGGVPEGFIMTAQVLAGAAVMAVAMRAERIAVRAFYRLQAARESAELARAQREEEHAVMREVHNGPLTTLTMALDPGRRPTAMLRHRAGAVLAALTERATPETAESPAETAAGTADGRVRLDERLSQVLVWYEEALRIAASLHPVLVPAEVAEAIAAAVSEALENTVRHAATDGAMVEVREDAGTVRVTVSDDGRGFDPATVSGSGFGLREDLRARMAAVGGSAVIRSAAGAGAVVTLAWRHD